MDAHHAHHREQEGADVAATLLDGPALEGRLAQEAVGEADGAQLEAAGVDHLARLADHELGGAPAYVDQEVALIEHGHGLEHAQVDEAGLLRTRHHVHLDSGFIPGPPEELVAVLGLPHRAGGHSPDLGPGPVGQLAEAAQGVDPSLHGVGGEDLHVARARPQAHDLLLAVDHLEAAVALGPGHHQVDGVGTDVDGRHRLVRHEERGYASWFPGGRMWATSSSGSGERKHLARLHRPGQHVSLRGEGAGPGRGIGAGGVVGEVQVDHQPPARSAQVCCLGRV